MKLNFRSIPGSNYYRAYVRPDDGQVHTAEHEHLLILDEATGQSTRLPIDDEIKDFIQQRFLTLGETLSFVCTPSQLKRESNSISSILPDSIRHKLTPSETSFTSTGQKLDHHYPIFEKLSDTGFGSIIRATLTLHQKCSSRCPYCSTIARSKSDSVTLQEAKDFVSSLYFDQLNLIGNSSLLIILDIKSLLDPISVYGV